MFPPEPPALAGLSPSFALPARFVAGGVVACVGLFGVEIVIVEFLRDADPETEPEALGVFLEDLVLVPPTGKLAPEPRLRFLITSVFKLRGLTTP